MFGKVVEQLFPETLRASDTNVEHTEVMEKWLNFFVHLLNQMKNLFVQCTVPYLECKLCSLPNESDDVCAIEV